MYLKTNIKTNITLNKTFRTRVFLLSSQSSLFIRDYIFTLHIVYRGKSTFHQKVKEIWFVAVLIYHKYLLSSTGNLASAFLNIETLGQETMPS